MTNEKKIMKINRYTFVLFFLLLAFLVSCATPRSPLEMARTLERPEECQAFLGRLDEKVKEAGVRDAADHSIPGFPYLRANRFLTALRKKIQNDAERDQWVRWMQELDLKGRKKEVFNLPGEAVRSLQSKEDGKPDREKLYSRVEFCSAQLFDNDKTRVNFYRELNPLVEVPDEYSTFLRVVGLYPLTGFPVKMATENLRKKFKAWYDMALSNLPVDGHLRAFVPDKDLCLDEKEVQELIEESSRNPLKVPMLERSQEEKLAWSFAPIFIQDVAAPYDLLGQIVWEGGRPEVESEKPNIYYYLSHAFLKGDPILQINYVIWYPARAGENPPLIERGHLDGLTARVSLDTQGKPFMVDVVNDCGCIHLFSPREERVERIIPWPSKLPPFIPQWLPTIPPGERLGIRINSGWHQVQRLLSVANPPDPIRYQLIPYRDLENLPHEEGWRESIFDSKGIVKSSERVERFILFSMGVPMVGSMRQRGHHAVEFIGRAHFDDPNLFDQKFVLK